MIQLFSAIANGDLLPTTALTLEEFHLVRCLTHISHRYLRSGRTLVISSPSTYRDMQLELIAEIHRTALWPVVVTVDGNISKPNKTEFIDRDGSYIILIPDGNINRFRAEFIGLAMGRSKFTRIWDSEARFVVAGANEYSKLHRTQIFEFFSKHRIYNCIIINQEHFEKEKEYSRPTNINDVDTGMKLGVYTWFPYQSSDRCTEVNDITLLDSWVISAQGYFTENTDLFPVKIKKNLYGCPMKAVVRNGHNYFTTNYVYYIDSNGTNSSFIEGLEFDLLKVVLLKLNMTFVHVPVPKGSELQKNYFTKLIIAMLGKEAYIALGSLGTHILSEPFFDSTNSYFMMNFRWYVPCSIKYPRWSSLFRILSLKLWLVLIISIVTAAISTTLVGRYSCRSEWQVYKTLTSAMTNVWAVILGVSVSTMPRAPSLRSLFLAWVCFSMAFSTVFQAFLTSFLIDSGYKIPIRNMEELFASGIKLAYPDYSFIIERGEKTELSKIVSNRVICPSFNVCIKWLENEKNLSVLLSDKFVDDLYANGDFVGNNSERLVCMLEGGIVYTYGQSMFMFHGDPLMSRVTEIIDHVIQASLYKYWISLKNECA